MQNRVIRCDDPSTDALNKIVGKSIGHCWIVVEWEEVRYTPGGYSYANGGGAGGNQGYYPNAGGGGVNGNNPETVTKKAKKKMCQYCGIIETISL